MLKLDRPEMGPDTLSSERAELAREAARRFFTQGKKRLRRHEFDVELWQERDVVEAVTSIAHKKCAYCEAKLRAGDEEQIVDHFRPFEEALGGDTPAPNGYWWLAYAWENLLPACALCRANKGLHFPVLGDRLESPDDREEDALLLDPTLDNPLHYLRFRRDGRVEPLDVTPAIPSALKTIEVIGLNRPDLVRARGERFRALVDAVKPLLGEQVKPSRYDRERIIATVLDECDAKREHAGALRSWLRYQALKQDGVTVRALLREDRLRSLASELEFDGRRSSKPWATFTLGQKITRRRIGSSVAGASGRPDGATETESDDLVLLRSIHIENCRGIKKLDLRFTEGSKDLAGRRPWTVLLGENSTGKSSVLQAVAIALGALDSGEPELDPDLRRSIERSLLRQARGSEQGKILLEHSKDRIVVEFDRNGMRPSAGMPKVERLSNLVVRAYGANRVIRRTTSTAQRATSGSPDHTRIELHSLFDPWIPLPDPSTWLDERKGEDRDRVRELLGDLLGVPKDADPTWMRWNRSGAMIDPGTGPVRFDLLSDGYQVLVAIAVDLMRGMNEKLGHFRSSSGIVLLDELGTHLHPRWRMRIVPRLRAAFPRIQFLATTHEPLCLRGLDQHEVIRLERSEGEIIAIDDLPSPA
ncbi:MAG: AAA family ATPase, partial [Planctomycetes bacterium]|nr:AAA family ATPase [Planctomycetota bacterium]